LGKTNKNLTEFEKLIKEAYPKPDEDAYPQDLKALVSKFLEGQELSVKEVKDDTKLKAVVAEAGLTNMESVEVGTKDAKVFVVGTFACEPSGGGSIGAAVSAFEARINLRVVDAPQEKILDDIVEKVSSSGLSQAMACKSAVSRMINEATAGFQKKIGNVL
jgi:hypothetical protein